MSQRTKSRRGMSLVEGMISMAILVIGILGALQGILFASQQNSVAGRLARATSMAAQIRLGLEAQGRTKLLLPAGPIGNSAICIPVGSASATLKALTDGLDGSLVVGACIVDVDAFDNGAAQIDKLVGSYDFPYDYAGGNGPFRRVLVYLPSAAADTFAVIVSTKDTGRRIFVKQMVGLYNSSPTTGNGTLVNL
ncbi:MAG: putative prepilin-type protein [Myxococcaceae bacterium]|nr:putative prepilin-type protein [Myxococcaceae bacterium]